jgi:hypothetical protein
MAAVMVANGQSRSQRLRTQKQGTTIARIGNQLIGAFDTMLFYTLAGWHGNLPDAEFTAEAQLPSADRPRRMSSCRVVAALVAQCPILDRTSS